MKLKLFSCLIATILLCQQIQSGGLVSKSEPDLDNEQLISAVNREREDELNLVLSQQRSNVNVRINNNKSLLHVLIERHVASSCDTVDCFHTKAFQRLIDAGADINALVCKDRFFYFFYHWLDITPLHLAAQHCLPKFVEILLGQNAVEIRGQAFKLADVDRGTGTCFSPLQLAQNAEYCAFRQRTIELLGRYEEDHPGQPKYYSSIPDYCPPFD